ncbi:MAG TPA: 23S rRNA (adenine(2030)-N(6))-methyltransferase RlmJ [Methylocella sp.]|nr:23S rRNA (adenine(2030)-N(6))-methyltransferase RlmJ [Methylocella sp.]
MNYRHHFHAGNFADVFKHVFLTLILRHLARKETPFRYIDTHAGDGLYELPEPVAGKNPEWHGGIGKLMGTDPPPEIKPLIAPYLEIASPLFLRTPRRYGGAPYIAKTLLRRQDRMLGCELHAESFSHLKAVLGRDSRIKLFERDGYGGLKAFVPPVERRGLVLIDPPFEHGQEFEHASAALINAWHKWASGIFLFWYPVKASAAGALVCNRLLQGGVKRILRLELQIDRPAAGQPLSRCGLILINPSFLIDEQAAVLLPWLTGLFAGKEPAFQIAKDG